jgi:hypothetical protein
MEFVSRKTKALEEIAKWTKEIAYLLRTRLPRQSNSLVVKILVNGEEMGQPVTLTLGEGPVVAEVEEFSGPSGTGTVVPDEGTIEFSSDTPAVATVDTNGNVTPIAVGTANITAVDSSNAALTDTVPVTVVAAAPESLVLTIPTN